MDIIRQLQQVLDVVEAAKMLTRMDGREGNDESVLIGRVGYDMLMQSLEYLRAEGGTP